MNSPEDHLDLERLRRTYRPESVRLLLVGESPPAGGTFFYRGNSLLARYTCEAFSRVYGPYADMAQFLTGFRDRGCYLVDLCQEPVDGLPKPQRRAARKAGIDGLSHVLHELQPVRIVAVLKGIEPHVLKAAADAGVDTNAVSALPFPAMGHQHQYVEGLVAVLRAME